MLSSFAQWWDSVDLNETLEQGIFASEREMRQMEDTKISIFNKFISIAFDEKDASRSKLQAIEEFLRDVKNNAKEYESTLFMTGKMKLQ